MPPTDRSNQILLPARSKNRAFLLGICPTQCVPLLPSARPFYERKHIIRPKNAIISTLFVPKTQLYLEYSSIKCYYYIAENLFGGNEDDGKTGNGAVKGMEG